MWQATTAGEACILGGGDPRKLTSSDDWGPERTIRGHVLAELLLRAGASGRPAIRRVGIQGAHVTGEVDLSHADMTVAVELMSCLLEGTLNLGFARTRTLLMEGCVLASVDATGASIEGSLAISKSDVRHAICLIDAEVSRSILFDGLKISGADGLAVRADSLRADGNVFLRRGFSATGMVRLRGAQIGGQLECSGGRFDNATGTALDAEGTEIGGDVCLNRASDARKGFHATGAVRLLGARIGGDLNCSGGRFDNRGRVALRADGAYIRGAVFLTDCFCATGEVQMIGARITGQLDCSGGRFENPKGIALGADRADIRGSVFLRKGFHAAGAVQIVGSQIGGQLAVTNAVLSKSDGDALNLQSACADMLVLRGPNLDVSGGLDLLSARFRVLADDPAALPDSVTRLNLDGLVYEQIAPDSPRDVSTRLRWLKRQTPGYHPQPFDQLAAVFRRNGQDHEAREVLIAKRRKRRETLHGWWRKCGDRFLDFSMRYGWQPWRPLVFGFGVLLLVFGLVSRADAAGLVVSLSDVASPYNAFIHALDVFLPVVDLAVESHWTIDTASGGEFAWLVMAFLWFLKLVGWGTVTMAVAALTGIVKRE